MKFRYLKPEEVECRVQSSGLTKTGGWAVLLIYKTARTDYALLDEIVGADNWQCDYKVINDNLYCGIGIKADSGEWIWKWNCGVESNTEKEKGEASDSMKRAGFVVGIGRELYTAPSIIINCSTEEFKEKNGKQVLKTQFSVADMVVEDGLITKLIIIDDKLNKRFEMGKTIPAPSSQAQASPQKPVDPRLPLISELTNLYKSNESKRKFIEEYRKGRKFADMSYEELESVIAQCKEIK